jgi:hypothetical protein
VNPGVTVGWLESVGQPVVVLAQCALSFPNLCGYDLTPSSAGLQFFNLHPVASGSSSRMALIQLIYVSSDSRQLDRSDVAEMLDSAVRHNAANDVTGMLLYYSGNFMQVLEGEETAIDEVMSRISADDRHQDITEISRKTVPSRDFREWSMGFHDVSAKDAQLIPGYAPLFEHGFNAAELRAKPGVALELLKRFAKHNA